MDKVRCIIVGAGPAGSACALALARKGIETVLIERGRDPGDKSVASFVLFPGVLKHLLPNYRDEAPLERSVTGFTFWQLGKTDLLNFQTNNYQYLDDPVGFTAFKSRFDAWFAGKATEAGVELITGRTVTDLIIEDKRIIGIKVDGEELYADVVVGADGVHSIVAEKSGLAKKLDLQLCQLGVKEVLDLPSTVIEERFHLLGEEGSVIHGVGCYPVDDVLGGFSLYTNKDSVSLAIFGTVNSLKEKQIKLHERLEMLKNHPHVKRHLNGSSLREYEARLLSYGASTTLNRLYADGVILCGDAGGFQSASYVGVPGAMLSGMMAAETIEVAIKKNDFSRRTLKNYIKYIDTTALPHFYKEAKRMNKLMIKNSVKIPAYVRCITEICDGLSKDNIEFINKKRYPVVSVLYFTIIQDFIPFILRLPLNAIIKTVMFFLKLIKKVTFRRPFDEWKKKY